MCERDIVSCGSERKNDSPPTTGLTCHCTTLTFRHHGYAVASPAHGVILLCDHWWARHDVGTEILHNWNMAQETKGAVTEVKNQLMRGGLLSLPSYVKVIL